MYKYKKSTPTTLRVNDSYEAESIEKKVYRITNNKEPISDSAPIIYTDRKEGVQPAYNIRTDRFEVAVEAMDKIDKTNKAKREERAKLRDEKNKKGEEGQNKGVETPSTQATEKQG